MVGHFQLNGLILRKPSLRGHVIGERQTSGPGFTTFSAIERSTQQTRLVYQTKHHTSSAISIATMLVDSGIDFEALRLRNGNLCFVANSNQQVSPAKGARPNLFRTVKCSTFQKWPFIFVGVVSVGVLAAAALVGGGKDPTPPDPAPTTEVISCDEFSLSNEQELRDFLEVGEKSSMVEFNIISSLDIGGLRSVEIVARCKMGPVGGELTKTTQRWRATLGKSKNKWAVTKMIRLAN